MRRPSVLTALTLTLCGYASARYSVNVNVVPGLMERVHTIAIAPGDCTPGIDCLWLEEKLFAELAMHRELRVIPARDVRARMFELKLDELNDQSRVALAEKLGADAFLVPIIQHSDTIDLCLSNRTPISKAVKGDPSRVRRSGVYRETSEPDERCRALRVECPACHAGWCSPYAA